MDRGLGESFRMVRQQLDTVQQNLSEMQSLASNVGDLRRVLTNVSRRGNWGVVRLSSLLEASLSADQYAADVRTKRGSEDRVQFAVRLPGREPGDDKAVWLPIDAGVSLAMYQRLIDARDGSDANEVEEAGAAMEAEIRSRAQAIREKFVDPPQTTDFAVMFMPVEGLYAEVLRRHGLAEEIQRDSRVVVTGPTTLAALLNSLQMGFRSLAIEQRSIEVWRLLAAVKSQFDEFGQVLGAVQAKLHEASTTISAVETHARQMQQQLGNVGELELSQAAFANAALPAGDANESTEEASDTRETVAVPTSVPSEQPAAARFE
jgi:DNA recombination protein RmuC